HRAARAEGSRECCIDHRARLGRADEESSAMAADPRRGDHQEVFLDGEGEVDLSGFWRVAPRQADARRAKCERADCGQSAFRVHTAPAATRRPTMSSLAEFKNEPLTDFTKPENKSAMEAALQKVKQEFGRDYPLVIGGERVTGLSTFDSINPS